jgi:hypothetical protein
MVDYRSNTLPAAKRNAANNGYAGAFYPWTSALTGDMGDECYGAVTDASGKVIADPNKSCTQQLHLQSDVALAQWEYYEATGDKEMACQRGWPVLEAVAQFWESKATAVPADMRLITCRLPTSTPPTRTTTHIPTPKHHWNCVPRLKPRAFLANPRPHPGRKLPAASSRQCRSILAQHIYTRASGLQRPENQAGRRGDADLSSGLFHAKSMAIDDLNYYTPRTDVDGPAMTDAIHSIAAATVDAPGCSAYTYMVRSYQPFLREPYLQFSEFAPVKLTATAYDFLTGVGGFMQEFLFGFSGLPPARRCGAARSKSSTTACGNNAAQPGLAGSHLYDAHRTQRNQQSPLTPVRHCPCARPAERRPCSPEVRSSFRHAGPICSRRIIWPAAARSRHFFAAGSPAVARCRRQSGHCLGGRGGARDAHREPRKAGPVGKITVVRGSRDPFPYSVQISSDGVHWKTVATAPATAAGIDAGNRRNEIPPVRAKFVSLVFQEQGCKAA